MLSFPLKEVSDGPQPCLAALAGAVATTSIPKPGAEGKRIVAAQGLALILILIGAATAWFL